jgi:hypothetical protein
VGTRDAGVFDLSGGEERHAPPWSASSPAFPAFLVLVLVLSWSALLNLTAQLCHSDIRYVVRAPVPAADAADFLAGARALDDRGDPYLVARYVTPPLPALLLAPLAGLPFDAVRIVFAILLLCSTAASIAIVTKALRPAGDRVRRVVLFLGLATLCFSYPFLFLFERGNIDGFVLLLLALAILWLDRRPLAAGATLALAASFKVYPALLAVPMAVRRRWRVLVGLAVVLAALFLMVPNLWLEYVSQRVASRAETFKLEENTSIVATFLYGAVALRHLLGAPADSGVLMAVSRGGGLIVYAVLLGSLLLADVRGRPERGAELVLPYLPFLIAIPPLSYHYALVALLLLIPLLCRWWEGAITKGARVAVLLAAVGIALAQAPSLAFSLVVGSVYPQVVNGAGLLLVMVSTVLLRRNRFAA